MRCIKGVEKMRFRRQRELSWAGWYNEFCIQRRHCWILQCTSALYSSIHPSLPRLNSAHRSHYPSLSEAEHTGRTKTNRDQHRGISPSSPSTSSLGSVSCDGIYPYQERRFLVPCNTDRPLNPHFTLLPSLGPYTCTRTLTVTVITTTLAMQSLP